LDSAGVPSLLVKGIVLAHEFYADVSERPLSDVDVLVRPRDFPRVISIARQRGWPRLWDSKVLGVVNIRVRGIFCDVAAFVGPAGTCALGVSDLLERAERSERGLGFAHARPELHDHALLMSIDLFKDKFGWAKPHAREDLVRLAAHADFEPSVLVARARQAQLATMLSIITAWILENGRSEGWVRVGELLAEAPTRQRYATRYREAATAGVEGYPWRAALIARMVSDVRWRRLAAPLLGAVGLAVFLGAKQRMTGPRRT
jgi:hypothetical protein